MIRLLEPLEARVSGRGVASVTLSTPGVFNSAWTTHPAPEPRFLAYSITKTFTAALILRLCETGGLALHSRLARWFPGVPRAGDITIRQLLNHTSGIPDYGPLPEYHEAVRTMPSEPWTFERFGAETWEKGLLFQPGQGWAYSNPGYMLLKAIAERVGGKSYRAMIDEVIARPLSLRDTIVAESLADLQRLAPAPSRYVSPDGLIHETCAHYHPGWVSHGVIASTAFDVSRFVQALFNGRLISVDSLKSMLEVVPIGPGEHHAYGLGLMADTDPSRPVGHNGSGPGYVASVFHDRARNATACVMAGIEDGFDAEAFVYEVLALA